MRQQPVLKTSSTEYVQRAETKSHEYMCVGDLKAENENPSLDGSSLKSQAPVI